MGIKPRRIVHDLIGKFRHFGRMVPLTNAQIRVFKAQAQRLKATLKVGKEGLSLQFLAALDDALKHHELVKVKFDDFKEQKRNSLHNWPKKAAAISSHGWATSSCSIIRSQRSPNRGNNSEGGQSSRARVCNRRQINRHAGHSTTPISSSARKPAWSSQTC
jgi:RNA-binding protein YhbY